MKITIVTASKEILLKLISVYKRMESQYAQILDLNLIYGGKQMSVLLKDTMASAITDSDAVIVDLAGSPETVILDARTALKKSNSSIVPFDSAGKAYLKRRQFTTKERHIEKVVDFEKARDQRDLSQLVRCMRKAGEDQLETMLYLLLRDYEEHTQLSGQEAERGII